VLLAVVGLGALVAVFGLVLSPLRMTASDPSTGAANLLRGEAIYAEACASCHGANLEGQVDWQSASASGRLPAPPHDASGHTWHHSDRLLLDIMRRGTANVVGGGYASDMPGFGDIYTDQELRDVLAWIKTHWPERERDFQAEASARDPES
jgi:mono/diheme cytochrome c family protein